MAKPKDLRVCIDCDEVFEYRKAPGWRCPACASEVSMPLNRWVKGLDLVRTMASLPPNSLRADKLKPTFMGGGA